MIAANTINRMVLTGLLCLALSGLLPDPGLQAATGRSVQSRNPARFVDNGNGTVLDRQTGLMWLKNGQATLGAITWKEAGAFCEGLNYGGYSDWRLPTRKEWATILDRSNQRPALPLKSPFENVVTFLDYWTMNDHTYGPGYAWAVNLYYGKNKFLGKKKYAFAWPVRTTKLAVDRLVTPERQSRGGSEWLSLKTKHTLIHYSALSSLEAFSRSLYPQAVDPGPAGARLGQRVDALYRDVQSLLDMRKAGSRVIITVYADRQQMETALRKTIGKGERRRAWYSPQKNTIFVSVGRLSEDILAHEMALAIIYQYMQVPPPRTTAKILAGYVDSQRKSRRGRPVSLALAGPVEVAPAQALQKPVAPAPEAAAKKMPARPETGAIEDLVQTWQAAWQNKQLEDYISHYHPDFIGSGKTLAAWKRHKNRLNRKYRQIIVSVTGLKTNVKGSKARAWFKQHYESDAYHSDGFKVLEFRKKDGEWRIFREKSYSTKPANWPGDH